MKELEYPYIVAVATLFSEALALEFPTPNKRTTKKKTKCFMAIRF
jgi:hypothetical protein